MFFLELSKKLENQWPTLRVFQPSPPRLLPRFAFYPATPSTCTPIIAIEPIECFLLFPGSRFQTGALQTFLAFAPAVLGCDESDDGLTKAALQQNSGISSGPFSCWFQAQPEPDWHIPLVSCWDQSYHFDFGYVGKNWIHNQLCYSLRRG